TMDGNVFHWTDCRLRTAYCLLPGLDGVKQPQASDLGDLGEGGVDLLAPPVLQPYSEVFENAGFVMLARADHEWEAKLLAIRAVEPRECRVLIGREPVEPGRRLLPGRFSGQLAGDRRLAGQIGVGLDQRDLPLDRRGVDCGAERLV